MRRFILELILTLALLISTSFCACEDASDHLHISSSLLTMELALLYSVRFLVLQMHLQRQQHYHSPQPKLPPVFFYLTTPFAPAPGLHPRKG